MPKIYVELAGSTELDVLPRKNAGVVVLGSDEFETMRTLADLRVHVREHLSEQLTRDFVFVRDQVLFPVAHEAKTDVEQVLRRRATLSLHTGYKVTIKLRSAQPPVPPQPPPLLQELERRRLANHTGLRSPIMSFAASPFIDPAGTTRPRITSFPVNGLSGAAKTNSPSKLNPCAEAATLSGFILRLDHCAAAGGDREGGNASFVRYFCKVDSACNLYLFGPCDQGAQAADFDAKTRRDAVDHMSLSTIYKIKPYTGHISAPSRHFSMEVLAENGAVDCVLAIASVVEFARWVRAFHRASHHLRGVQYNINHENFTWTVSALDDGSYGGVVSTPENPPRGGGGGGGGGEQDGGEQDGGEQDGDASEDLDDPRGGRAGHINTFHEAYLEQELAGMDLIDCPAGTMVAVAPGSLAAERGFTPGSVIVAVGDTSAVGKPAHEVKRMFANAHKPVRVTFGTPDESSPRLAGAKKDGARFMGPQERQSLRERTDSAENSSLASSTLLSALAWRRRLGPFLYGRSKEPQASRQQQFSRNLAGPELSFLDESVSISSYTDADEALMESSVCSSRSTVMTASTRPIPTKLPPGKLSRYDGGAPPGLAGPRGQIPRYTHSGRRIPLAPPRAPKPRKKPSGLFGSLSLRRSRPSQKMTSSLEETDISNASRAASRQLSRYRGIQSRLFSAIQTSYALEERVDEAVQRLVREAHEEALNTDRECEKPQPPPLPPPLSPPPLPPLPGADELSVRTGDLGPAARTNALSSRLQSARFPETKVARMRSMLDPAHEFLGSDADSERLDRGNSARIASLTSTASLAGASAWGETPTAAPPRGCGLAVCSRAVSGLMWAKDALASRADPSHEKLLRLIDLARRGDTEDREDALEAILEMASTSKNLATLVQEGMLEVLVGALRSQETVAIRENAAGILWNLSDDFATAQAIVASGAIQYLLKLLRYPADDIKSSDVAKEEAAGALWALADLPEGRAEILAHRGVGPIVRNLAEASETTDFTQENLVGIIWHLSFDAGAVDEIMRRRKHADVVAELARLIIRGTLVSQENAAGALMHMSFALRHRRRIRQCADAIPALVQLLAFGSVLGRENACGALHNLAVDDDRTQRLIAEEGAIIPLVRLLQTKFSVTVRVRAALCLRTLSQNRDNKKEILDAGAADNLIGALSEEAVLLQIHYIEALWGLIHESEANKEAIVKSGAIPKLVNVLRTGDATARSRAAGALGSLAESSEILPMVAGSGALEPLVQMLRKGDASSRREAAGALGNLTMGSVDVQNKVMRSLRGGAVLAISDAGSDMIQSVRARLLEIEVGDEALLDEYYSREDLAS